MTLEEWNYLLSHAGAFGIGVLVCGLIVFLFIKSFIPSYLSQKAANLATKEDIAAVTKEVEEVKSQYAVLLEELKARHQLRLAALDKRLQVHQEAFTLWREFKTVYTPAIGKAVEKCQYWWEQNCVYLEPDVRRAFADAFSAPSSHSFYVESPDPQLVMNNWKIIEDFPNLLFSAVQLPTLTSTEAKALGLNKQ